MSTTVFVCLAVLWLGIGLAAPFLLLDARVKDWRDVFLLTLFALLGPVIALALLLDGWLAVRKKRL